MNKRIVMVALLATVTLTAALTSGCKKNDDGETLTDMEQRLKDGELRGTLTKEATLDASKEYRLTGPFIVAEGATINIPAGTTIRAQEDFSAYILVLMGGRININGTAEKPVTITTIHDNPGSQRWGGLIINGKARLSSGKGSTEINDEYQYGGDDDDDNSGTIRYLILRYPGARSSANVEHNGLTLNGVGRGTTIENVYVHESSDDAIEFFGGCVNVKNILAINPDDDMFDFTQGYRGTLTNAYGIWEKGYTSSEDDPRGVEADGNLDGVEKSPAFQSDFSIVNMTIDLQLAPVAKLDAQAGQARNYMEDVIKIRRGAKATITNALVKGTGSYKDFIDFTDKKGDGDPTSTISITNKLVEAPSGKMTNGNGIVELVPSSTGCSSDLFAWTGFTNF